MSYDIRFGVRVAGTDKDVYVVIGEPEYASPTYSNREIFVKSMDWDYKQGEWYPITDVLPKIERGIHELTFNAKAYKSLEPENGWGGIGSARKALESIVGWFSDDWGSGWKGGWNADIPIDYIYMSW